jgi:hypothetical protein
MRRLRLWKVMKMLLESNSVRESAGIEVAPDFTLEDSDGQSVSLSDFRHRRHVVLVFNRGFT